MLSLRNRFPLISNFIDRCPALYDLEVISAPQLVQGGQAEGPMKLLEGIRWGLLVAQPSQRLSPLLCLISIKCLHTRAKGVIISISICVNMKKLKEGAAYFAGVLCAVGIFCAITAYLRPEPNLGLSDYREYPTDARGTSLASLRAIDGSRVFPVRSRQSSCLVVAMGSCASCAARAFAPEQRTSAEIRVRHPGLSRQRGRRSKVGVENSARLYCRG